MYRKFPADVYSGPEELIESDAPNFYEESYQILSNLEPILPHKVGVVSSFYSNGELIVPADVINSKRPDGFDIHSIILDGRNVYPGSADEALIWQHTQTSGYDISKSTTVTQLGFDLVGLHFAHRYQYDFQGRLVHEENLTWDQVEKEQRFLLSALGNDTCRHDINKAFASRQRTLDSIKDIDDELQRLSNPDEIPKTIDRVVNIPRVCDDYVVKIEINETYLKKQREGLEKSLARISLTSLTPRKK
ncbi:hypothetical protein DYH10_00420 [Candidatus Saccharibacteria bacterium CPR2]|nr:hypothetical protein [Candidatus Saccharibacteria bacterium CPR2]